jgi:hypothetical protein
VSDCAFRKMFPLGADARPHRKLTEDFVAPARFIDAKS